MFAKAAMVIGWMDASVPPTTTTSARPSRIMAMPSATASEPEAQAETGVWAPARAPSSMEMLAAEEFAISIGTVKGLTRRAPRSRTTSHWSSVVQMPPMPVPTTTPRRVGSTSGAPASAQASRAATIAYWPEGSSFFDSGRLRESSAPGTRRQAKSTESP